MSNDIITRIAAQPQAELQAIVSQILGQTATPVGTLEVKKIGRSAGHATAGVFRVSGHARAQEREWVWAAVVKALGNSEIKSPTADYDPYLEVEVYRTRAFAEVCGGVRSPHCYAIQPQADLLLLWLEDLSGAPQPPWEAHHFVATAHHLGQFNAHWPEQALPAWTWLNQHSFRADFTQSPKLQSYFTYLSTQQSHPLIQIFAPGAELDSLIQLRDACDLLLCQAELTAAGVCHMDAHPKNLFPILNGETDSYTIAIDWVKVGISNLGVDIGQLLASPLTWLEVTPEGAVRLRDAIFDAYLGGLADAGWSGNADGVRLTYLTRLACEALRNTNIIANSILNPQFGEVLERFFGQPLPEICACYRTARDFYQDCKDEAQRLAQRMNTSH